jgi:hypothetical protein
MTQVANWLSSNTATLSIFGAAVAFVWSTMQQIIQRRAEAEERQFQAFHKIVEQVVSPESKDGSFYRDRQAAVIFELRHFPRYYEFTERLLARLKAKWGAEKLEHSDLLLEEIDLSLKYIKKRNSRKVWTYGHSLGQIHSQGTRGDPARE